MTATLFGIHSYHFIYYTKLGNTAKTGHYFTIRVQTSTITSAGNLNKKELLSELFWLSLSLFAGLIFFGFSRIG
ncbi:MAG: hypothetical protein A3J48_03220 [Candidatus Doudnabacteria bacterium RIFCSPHIGHO2_02_FULL_46_11]|uniref:Uncharacterized protein n=1 Tax=Candidatus Doudnabacteria bacterium RIFCSPHIGHO2_02_FULL_46_11 TaxID=1817832 RepID=A0A1F5P7U9_9BACT|nr:MAG: hypothetical protein A3J48_03220 [Candidatus Doudnabacteria bacterium RIFCSPHIGHO2_02_FULL_46_11]